MSIQTTNTFQEGLMMDLNPLITPSNVMTNCLNGTLLTYKGNENVLQNDMGNGRVETAFLPEGYIPLGTCELGGIIYIVSYNPLTKQSQIGSFPSPERNILQDEIPNILDNTTIEYIEDFTGGIADVATRLENESDEDYKNRDPHPYKNIIKTPLKRVILLDRKLYPGDLFKIYSKDADKSSNILSAYNNSQKNSDLDPRYLKLNVISVEDDGTITNLNDSMVWDQNYYIQKGDLITENEETGLDNYRKLVGEGYTPFMSQTSGKLGILAQLETITNFDCAWDAIKKDNTWNMYFYTNWEYDNEEAKDKINLYGIKVEIKRLNKPKVNYKDPQYFIIKKYPIGTNNSNIFGETDIIKNISNSFYSPAQVDSEDDSVYNDGYIQQPLIDSNKENILRKNDGSDYQYLITKSLQLPDEGTYEITVSPLMPFGTLDYLKKTFIINIDQLGSGDINLKEYRYYYDDKNEKITLNWGLEAYPERKKNIQDVTFNFYDYLNSDPETETYIQKWVKRNSQYIDNGYVENDTWIKDNKEQNLSPMRLKDPNLFIKIDNQTSYNGNFIETFGFSSYNTKNRKGQINKYGLYLVEIVINYGPKNKNAIDKTLKYYRFMYTTDIFNGNYHNIGDFKKIKLSDVIFNEKNFKYNLVLNPNIGILDNKLYDTDSKEIESLDSFLETDSSKTQEYLNKIEYNIQFKPIIKCTSLFKKVNISDIEVDNFEFGAISQPDSTILNPNKNIITEKDLNEIGFDKSPKGNYILSIPIKCVYNKKESKVVPYIMTKLTSNKYYLNTWHRDKGSEVRLKSNLEDSGNVEAFALACDEYYIASRVFEDTLNEDFKQYDIIKLAAITTTHEHRRGQSFQILQKKGGSSPMREAGENVIFTLFALSFSGHPIQVFFEKNYYGDIQIDNVFNYYKIAKSEGELINGHLCYVIYYPDFVTSIEVSSANIKYSPTIKIGDSTLNSNNNIENLNIESKTFTNLKDYLNIPVSVMDYVNDLFGKDYSQYIKVDNKYEIGLPLTSLYKKENDKYIPTTIKNLEITIQDGKLRLTQGPTNEYFYRSEEEKKNNKHQSFELKVYRI